MQMHKLFAAAVLLLLLPCAFLLPHEEWVLCNLTAYELMRSEALVGWPDSRASLPFVKSLINGVCFADVVALRTHFYGFGAKAQYRQTRATKEVSEQVELGARHRFDVTTVGQHER
jgi:hypothetical protein